MIFASFPLQGARRGTIAMLALACGVMVANIYLCQPLLAEIALSFGVAPSMASLVAVATQLGYTLGILLVVPLADNVDPQKLVGRLLVLSAFGLLAAAVAPRLEVLVMTSLLIASTSIVAQVLIPLATRLAPAEYRGRIVSALSIGLILGILISRTASGAVAALAGSWRAPFVVQAMLVFVLRLVLLRFLPQRTTQASVSGYFDLLRSLVPLLRHGPLLLSMGLSFCVFATFSAVWATLAFHLASAAFNLGPASAGLFGLWGAPGALLAPLAGRLADRWGPNRINAVSLAALTVSLAIALRWGSDSIAGLVLAVNLLDFGTQSGQVANQTRIFGLGDAIRGRLNTLYMVTTFAGGATGALVGGWAWTFAGWRGVCLVGCALVAIATVILGGFATAARLLGDKWTNGSTSS